MSESPPPAPPPAERRETPWRLIVFGALAVYAILIVLFNRKQVEVSFVFFSAEISLLVLILLFRPTGLLGESLGRARA